MVLTKRYYRETGDKESSMMITVEYDIEEKVVDRILSVYVNGSAQGYAASTDIAPILDESFPDALDKLVDSVDWWEVFHATHLL